MSLVTHIGKRVVVQYNMLVNHTENIMDRYEAMSREELLDEILQLHTELLKERSHVRGLKNLLVTMGAEIYEERPDGYYAFGMKNTVLERRPYRNGQLTKEWRRNKKTGKLTGPYWQYRGVEDGKQINLYLGKTDDPESRAEAKLAERSDNK